MSDVITVSNKINGVYTFPQKDYGSSPTSTRFNGFMEGTGGTIQREGVTYDWQVDTSNVITSANDWFDFINGGDSASERTTAGVALGLNGKPKITSSPLLSSQNPSDWVTPKSAQRELKWRISLQDTVTGEFYTSDIGCANTAILPEGTESLPTEAITRLTKFLNGPQLTTDAGSGGEPAITFNLPLIRSNRDNPLKYVTSNLVGVKYKRN